MLIKECAEIKTVGYISDKKVTLNLYSNILQFRILKPYHANKVYQFTSICPVPSIINKIMRHT